MNQAIKVTRKQTEKILAASFPAYTGRKIQVVFTTSTILHDLNWSGGTKNDFAVIKADGTKINFNAPAPWVNIYEGAKVEITPNVIIVEHSHFCGKDMGITIHANPVYAPKWLGKGII